MIEQSNTEMRVRLVRGPTYDFRDAISNLGVQAEWFPSGYITDPMRKAMFSWRPEVAVGIFSPTGTGKNYFVENVLVPEVQRYRGRILLMGNRVALGRQTKLRLAKLFGEERKLLDYTDEGLDHLIEFGCLMVVSYQQLAEWVERDSPNLKKLEQNFAYVVADEVHYLLADSSFNATTDLALNYITSHFRESIRIYLTATPEQIFPVLEKKEKQIDDYTNRMQVTFSGYRTIHFNVYRFANDFSWIHPHAFQDADDIISLVRKSKDKTVIFVDNKDVGRNIIKAAGFGTLVTAESKNPEDASYTTYNEIVTTETFNERLLVCTAVLENGVNLKDANIKNVVIYANDKTRFLQMLGRVRRQDEQEVELYIPHTELSDVNKTIDSLTKQLKALRMFYADPKSFCDQFVLADAPRVNVRGSFTILNSKWAHVNELRMLQLEHFEIPFWEQMRNAIEEGDEFAVLREKFSWVEQDFARNDFIESATHDRAVVDFALLLEKWKGKKIEKEQQAEFQKAFSQKYKAAYGVREADKSAEQIYGLSTIKTCIMQSGLPYQIKNERGFWLIETVDENIEEE